MQGWRVGMEDAHIAVLDLDENTNCFAVCDGHGGKEVAIFVSRHFSVRLKNHALFKNNLEQAIRETFLQMD